MMTTTTTKWSCVWLFATVISITLFSHNKSDGESITVIKIMCGHLFVQCTVLFEVHGAWWSAVKMREFQSWFIMWYKMPCVTFNRSMFFSWMQNHFQSNTRTHTHKYHQQYNSFSPANFPATHRVIQYFVHVKHRRYTHKAQFWISVQVIENAHFHVSCVRQRRARMQIEFWQTDRQHALWN